MAEERTSQVLLNDVGAGWAQLVRQLERDLRALAPGYRVVQVKEKFGLLSFHVCLPADLEPGTVSAVRDRIDRAELASGSLCQVCGRLSELRRDRRWRITLCAEHHAKLERWRGSSDG